MSIPDVVARMQERLDRLPAEYGQQRVFLSTYQRTTLAIGKAVQDGLFEDAAWVEQWDVVFADLYLNALDAELSAAELAPRPWRLAFTAPAELPPLRHVLLGINAHVNYDLPQALLAMISDADFSDPGLIERRRRDHERIDIVLSQRVSAEDQELGGRRSLLDRVLTPVNRLASKRLLREARQRVWHNTMALQAARLAGPTAYADRLAELELLCAAKIADLLAPGQVLLRLAVGGFGVTLPPPA
jgi:hypothetical protein